MGSFDYKTYLYNNIVNTMFHMVGLLIISTIMCSCGESKQPSQSDTDTYKTPAPLYTPPSKSYNYPPVQRPTRIVRELTPDDAYSEGYDEGYKQGKSDGRHGHSHGYGYDDSSSYYDYYETRYQEGYEEGYDEGYSEGQSAYDDAQREKDEDNGDEDDW